MLSRRQMLALTGASLMARGASARGLDLHLGVQLWSVKDELRADFGGTLQRLAAAGYRRAELAELGTRDAVQTRDALRAAGLECISAHVRLWELDADLAGIIARAKTLGLEYLIVPVPWMPADVLHRALTGDMLQVLSSELTMEHWGRTAEMLNRYGLRLRDAGLKLAYHNHNIDFKPFGKEIPYEVLVSSTDPALVWLELDCGWVTSAGLDPVVYLRRWSRRYVALHVKDVKAGFVPNFAMQTVPVEVGAGVMDWPAILTAAWRIGVRQFYVEQEKPFVRPPLESMKISAQYLNRIARELHP